MIRACTVRTRYITTMRGIIDACIASSTSGLELPPFYFDCTLIRFALTGCEGSSAHHCAASLVCSPHHHVETLTCFQILARSDETQKSIARHPTIEAEGGDERNSTPKVAIDACA